MAAHSKPAGLPGGLSFLEPRGDALPRPYGNTYWLWPGHILAGEHPAKEGAQQLSQRLHALAKVGITHCIDLTSATEFRETYQVPEGCIRLSFPITDFGVPSVLQMQSILQTIHSAVSHGGQVFVHCHAGIGRTGTVSGTWLVEQGLSGDAALALLNQKWQAMAKCKVEPHSPETEAQRQWVRTWQKGL